MKAYSSSIGVLGGLGPYAGLDLVQKIFDCCAVKKDQDHLPVMLYSFPNEIPPRVEFLLGTTSQNPGIAMGEIMIRLADAGASVIGMPCNTAHSPAILDIALEQLNDHGYTGTFIHMVAETVLYIKTTLQDARRIGVLCTQGAYMSGIFSQHLHQENLEAIYPNALGLDILQHAISDSSYGIKAFSKPVKQKALEAVKAQAAYLAKQKVDAIVLGCTELPLALESTYFENIPLIDPTLVLARCLIDAYTKSIALA